MHRIVTNRCLDLLRSSAKKRELYVGPWLPEPLIEQGGLQEDPSEVYEQRESLSTAYLLLLQQLNAIERAVFLLRKSSIIPLRKLRKWWRRRAPTADKSTAVLKRV
ncbi:hypothetical protein N6H14_29980 [Paenibacillus sp. CC-CFT747]|nr:hypothetical protein N6H14_29980 [Paenibacillus sp. CC-CFT747]